MTAATASSCRRSLTGPPLPSWQHAIGSNATAPPGRLESRHVAPAVAGPQRPVPVFNSTNCACCGLRSRNSAVSATVHPFRCNRAFLKLFIFVSFCNLRNRNPASSRASPAESERVTRGLFRLSCLEKKHIFLAYREGRGPQLYEVVYNQRVRKCRGVAQPGSAPALGASHPAPTVILILHTS
jgi:hypothetical protein